MRERSLRMRFEGESERVMVRDLLAIGFRQRRTMVVTFGSVLALVVLVCMFLPKTYESQMKILVRHERADSVVSAEREAPQQLRTEVTEEELQSEAELLKSKDLLTKVVLACNLDKQQSDSFWSHTWRKPAKTSDASVPADESVASAVLMLDKKLAVRPIKLTNLISVTYSANDPQQAANVLRTLATLYLEKHLAMHRVPGAFDFFHKQAEEYRAALEKSEAKLTDFAHREGVVSPSLAREMAVRKLTELQASLRETQGAIRETQKRIETLQTQLAALPARHTTQVRTADNPQLMERLKSTLLELELKRSALLTKFEPSYRPVQEVEQQIQQAKDAIAAAEKAPLRDETTDTDPTYEALRAELARANTELAALQTREGAISNMVRSYRTESERLDQQDVVQQDMLRTAKANEENYLLYLRKQEEARISDALDRQRISNVLVAEEATIPFKPQRHRALLLTVGFVLACVASAVSAFLADRWDPSFRTPQELQDFLGAPVLAAFPKGE